MSVETQYKQQIQKVFDTLSLPIRLLDAQGNCLIPARGEALPLGVGALPSGTNQRMEGFLVRSLDIYPTLYLAVAADAPGASDILCLACAMVQNLLHADLSLDGCADVYRRVLKREITGNELSAAADEYQIPMEMPRCVLLLQLEKADKASAYRLFSELVPLADGDVLVEMNRHQVAFIKDMEGIDGIGELRQFAEALQETLQEEAVQSSCISIGIGEEKQNLTQLDESFAEALRALEVGRVFHHENTIHVFRHLMLERFLMNISREESLYYHGLLFNRRNAKLFNEEMLATIEMFFRKDLSLSDTARQLYIHRNTLAYRLDKVQRQTGLDLRSFEDAVTFKILYELKKCGQEKPKQID